MYDYHEIVRLMEMCTGFVSQLKEHSVVESVVAAKKTADVFATGDTLQVDALADMICQDEEQKQEFAAYREAFEKQNGGFADEVKEDRGTDMK